MSPSDLLSEVKLATLGVADLSRSIAFYQAGLKYQCIDRGEVPAALSHCWRFASEHQFEYAVLAPDESRLGMLRLLSPTDKAQITAPLWHAGNAQTGVGYYALNFRARSAHLSMAAIQAAGGRVAHQPSFWEVSPQVAVWDSISQDIDGNKLDLFSYERGGELRGSLETDVSVLQTIALSTRNIVRSVAFYQALGFQTLFDRVLDFPELGALLEIDGPVRIRNVNLMKDGSIVPGRIEMFCHLDVDAPEDNLSARAVPGALGILSISLVSSDIAMLLPKLESLGARQIASYRGQVPGFLGENLLQTMLGPDQERIELIQRLA